MTVEDFAVYPGWSGVGSQWQSLSSTGYDSESGAVTARCEKGEVADLLIQVTRTTDASAVAESLTVHWKSDRGEGSFEAGLGVYLCSEGDINSDTCPEV